MAQMVKNLPAMQETQVQSLGLEDPLEKGTLPGEGNGHPLQYSYLDNSMDRGAWRAADRKELDTTKQLSTLFLASVLVS